MQQYYLTDGIVLAAAVAVYLYLHSRKAQALARQALADAAKALGKEK